MTSQETAKHGRVERAKNRLFAAREAVCAPPFVMFASFARRLLLVPVAAIALVLAGCAKLPPEPARAPALQTLTPPPAELLAALKGFRAEGPQGWAYTLTTTGADKDRVEHFTPRVRGGARWTLISENGKAPTEEEQQRYRNSRPVFDAAAGLVGQLALETVDVVARDEKTATYEFALNPANSGDTGAQHFRAHFTQDVATGAILRVELFAVRAFKPARSLTILEARTTIAYLPPADGRPALPSEVVMHVKGKRFFYADFSQDVTSRFSDHEYVPLAKDADESTPEAAVAPTADAAKP